MVIRHLRNSISRLLLTVLFGTVASGAWSNDLPPACNIKEDPAICYLKIERNNAMDELAISQAQNHRNLLREQDNAEYWRLWVQGDLEKSSWWDRVWRALKH
jgi:hypothetical protein